MSDCRETRLQQIYKLVDINNEGVNIEPDLFKDLDYENTYAEQIRSCFDWNANIYVASKIPAGFRFKETGYFSPIYWNPASKFSIIHQEGKYYLTENKELQEEVVFERKPKFYNLQTSDGKDMSRIVQAGARGRAAITYSNECSLKEKGLDCLFCNINATKSTFGELDHIEWKYPKQIGEAVAAAYKEGYRGYNLTGGFVPERREVEYYIDVIEAVKEAGVLEQDIHGMACIGAPSDLSVIEKYKEAGYQHIATNLEIWDENYFKTICPGKDELCGGRANWIAALKHEVEVFGKGYVRSVFVSGIEPKESLLEGIEYLASLGVIAIPSIWKPCIGSAFEGHRSPVTAWHQEVLQRTYNIYKKYGFTLEQFYYVFAKDSVLGYLFELDGQTLPFAEKELILA
jgi:hypothetical protein